MRYGIWLLALLLTACATPNTTQTPFVLSSVVPVEGYDRTDLPCYYGVVW